ncbi:MAG: hypothetical protein JEZ06_20545 [Anaerolineaceae bacterium]|nr:hypothetical protein [Anaerolineaceae bacterium]
MGKKTDNKRILIPAAAQTSSREDQDNIESKESGVNAYMVFDLFIKVIKQIGLF